MPAYAAARQEQDKAEGKAQGGNHQQQGKRGVAVDDVAHGDTRGDAELYGPEIEREVGDGHNPGAEALDVVLHHPAQHQGHDQDGAHLLEDDDERSPEIKMVATLQEGKHGGNHEGGGQRGNDHEGRHRVDVAAYLGCHHGSCRRRRADDTGEHALPQDFLFRMGLDTKDNPAVQSHQQQLGYQYTYQPAVGAHLVEVNPAERGE